MDFVLVFFYVNIFVANIMLICVTPVALSVFYIRSWIWDDVTCRYTVCIQMISIVVMLWNATCVVVHKYRIVFTYPYRSIFTPYGSMLITVALWGLTYIIYMPLTFLFQISETNGQETCVLTMTTLPPSYFSFFMTTMLLVWILPVLVSLFFCCKTYRKYRRANSIESLVESSVVTMAGVVNGDAISHGLIANNLIRDYEFLPWMKRPELGWPRTADRQVRRHRKRCQMANDLLLQSCWPMPVMVVSLPFVACIFLESLFLINNENASTTVHTVFLVSLFTTVLVTLINIAWNESTSENCLKSFLIFWRHGHARKVSPTRCVTTTV